MSPSEAMVQEILDRSKAAGRDKLAELAYQMARTCLSAAETKSSASLRWYEDPRDVVDLGRDLRQMEVRVEVEASRADLPIAAPTAGSAIASARTCLRVVSGLEGESSRYLLLNALLSRAEGDLAEAVRILASMRTSSISRHWMAHSQETLQTVQLSLGEYDEVLEVGKSVLHHSPGRLLALFNMATARAWMNDGLGLETCCKQFRQSDEQVVDSEWWAHLLSSEAAWFANHVNRDPTEIVTMFGLPAAGGGGS